MCYLAPTCFLYAKKWCDSTLFTKKSCPRGGGGRGCVHTDKSVIAFVANNENSRNMKIGGVVNRPTEPMKKI